MDVNWCVFFEPFVDGCEVNFDEVGELGGVAGERWVEVEDFVDGFSVEGKFEAGGERRSLGGGVSFELLDFEAGECGSR